MLDSIVARMDSLHLYLYMAIMLLSPAVYFVVKLQTVLIWLAYSSL